MPYPKLYRDLFENDGAGPLLKTSVAPVVTNDKIAKDAITFDRLSSTAIATEEQVQEGTADNVLVTPKTLGAASPFNELGHLVLPDGSEFWVDSSLCTFEIYATSGLISSSASSYGKTLGLYLQDSDEPIVDLSAADIDGDKLLATVQVDPMQTYELRELVWSSGRALDRVYVVSAVGVTCSTVGDRVASSVTLSGFSGDSAQITLKGSYGAT